MSKVLVEHEPSPMKLEVMHVEQWPVAAESAGCYTRYTEQTETSYIIFGAGEISTEGCAPVSFEEGDLVTVMPDTNCVWNITEAIERHYSIG